MSKVKLIAAVGLKVRPVTDGFRHDVKRGVERELSGYNPDIKVHGEVDFDRAQVKREADKARRWAEEHHAEILAKLKVDKSAARDLDDLSKRFSDLDKRIKDVEKSGDGMAHAMDMSDAHRNLIKMREELERVSGTNKRIRDELRQADLATAESTSKAIEAARRRLNGQDWGKTAELRMQISSENARREAERAKREMENKLEGIKAKIKADPVGLELAAARMKIAARDRQVNFFVRVNAASLATAEGLLRSLAGLNVLSKTGDILQNVLKNFDTMALRGASWVAVGGSIADSMGWLAQAALGLGGSLANLGGFAVLAPTALAALSATMLVTTAVFTDFGKAVGGDAKALEKLPAAGQKAATQMATIWKDLREGISTDFWGGASKGMLDFTEKALPKFAAGIQKFSGSFGRSFGKVLDSFTAAGVEGKLTRMFDNLARGIDNMTPGVTALWNGINEVGLQGSQWLPRIGTYLSDNFKRFETWVDLNSKNGNMFMWVQNASTSFGQLWRSMGNTINIFRGLTRAAEEGGAKGLAGFESATRRIAEIFMGEPFQSRMIQIFSGANQGARALGEGAKIMATSLGESAGWLSRVLTLAGELSGGLLANLGRALKGVNFQSGVLEGLEGIRGALRTLEPGFVHLGSIVGGAMRIAGGAIQGIAPVINGLLSLVDSGVSRTSQNLSKLAGPLGDFIANRLALLQPIVDAAFDGVNNLLGAFNSLNPALQQGVVAIGAFLLFRNQLADMFIRMDGTRYLSGLKERWQENAAAARAAGDEVKRFSLSGAVLRDVRSRVDGVRDSFRMIRDEAMVNGGASRAMANLRTTGVMAMDGIKAAGSSLLGFLGGPWGLAFMAAGAIVAAFAQKQAEARQRTEELMASLDASGRITAESVKKVYETITNGDNNDPWSNLVRGGKSASETAKALGIDLGELARATASGGETYQGYADKLGKAATMMSDFSGLNRENRRDSKLTEEQLRAVADATGLSYDQLKSLGSDGANSVSRLWRQTQEARDAAEQATAKFSTLNGVVGETTAATKLLAAPMQTIRDLSQDAASKIGAINEALRILKGQGKQSAQEAVANLASTTDAAVQQAKTLAEGIKIAGQSMFGKDGLLDVGNNAAARGLYDQLKSVSDAVKIRAQAAADEAKAQGKGIDAINSASLNAVKSGDAELQKIADAAGVKVDDLKKQWGSFFGKDWQLTATFNGSADNLSKVMDWAKRENIAFNQADWTAFLKAHPEAAQQDLQDVQQKFKEWADGDYSARLRALPSEAQQKLRELLGMTQDQWVKGDFTAIMRAAKDSPSFAKVLAALLGIKDGNYTAIMKSLTDKGMLGKAESELNSTARNRNTSVRASANTSYAGWTLQNFVDTPRGTVIRVGANAAAAQAEVNGFISWASMQAISIGISAFTKHADGGILGSVGTARRFMAGGITGMEDHSAKIYAPSSTYRIFAEPETGGEAYIPMAASKRNRSTAILNEVASRFGYELTRSGRAFANGAITGGNSEAASRGMSFHVGTLNQGTNDTLDDLGRALVRQVRRSGLPSTLGDGI